MPTKKVSKKSDGPLERPSNITTLAVMTLVSGGLNILAGLGLTIAVVLGTFFFGIICVPITILPAILGVFEILYGVKLLAVPPKPLKPSQAIAILEIATFLYLNVISGVVGILAMVFYNDPEVKKYFEMINS